MNQLNPYVDLESLNASAENQKKYIESAGYSVGSMTDWRWSTLADQLLDLGLLVKKIPAQNLFRNF